MNKLETQLFINKPELARAMSQSERCPGDFVPELNHCKKDDFCALNIAQDIEHCYKCWLKGLEV